ncbi:MAG TPA: ABC transporter permease [Kineosporiaceae bacterium]|nr:ABC transporter permease [Kineosporiaceae bacterium]
MAETETPQAVPAGPVPRQPAASLLEREFTVRAMTQRELVTRRFLRHRGALFGLAVFLCALILAYTSIGALGLPGWWAQKYSTTGGLTNGGGPTLSLWPLRIGTHPFGQDDVGRDYFALTMRGTQRSILIALTVGLVATATGVVVGAVSGFFRGWVEGLLMRITDVFLTVPLLLIAAVVGRFSSGGPLQLAMLLGLLVWTSLARLVRGEFLSLREKEFVEAARAMGAGSGRIIFRHILPNSLGTIIVNATLTIAQAILLETSLSFLGFGVQSPDTSLGKLIADYESAFTTRPWLFWWPGLFIVAIALSVNFVGDGLRDAFDPKQTRVRA